MPDTWPRIQLLGSGRPERLDLELRHRTDVLGPRRARDERRHNGAQAVMVIFMLSSRSR